jgi:hypothetical protein
LTAQRLAARVALALAAWLGAAGVAQCYTANKVWFEFRRDGHFRVHVGYTVPELKEYRESYVDFARKKEAERFYWDLVRGADFFPSHPESRRFVQPVAQPEPW